MSISRPMTIAREDVVRALRAVKVDGINLEEPDFSVGTRDEFLLVTLPGDAARREFFRQVYETLGEDVALKLVRKHRPAGGVTEGQILHFPGVTVTAA